jgi:hypothetical protein
MFNPISPLGHGFVKLNPLSKIIEWGECIFFQNVL